MQDLLTYFEEHGIAYSREKLFSREYWEWEENVATPSLYEMVYTNIQWSTGERDSYGPLSRVVSATDSYKNTVRFMYG